MDAGGVLAARALLPNAGSNPRAARIGGGVVELLAPRGVAPRSAAQCSWPRRVVPAVRSARRTRAECSQREHFPLPEPSRASVDKLRPLVTTEIHMGPVLGTR